MAEFQYRFNRRFDLKALMPRILRASVLTLPQPSHILRLSEVGNQDAYWARQVFTGRSQPPSQVGNSAAVKLLVADNPNMVGYITEDQVDQSVKVILRIPSPPTS